VTANSIRTWLGIALAVALMPSCAREPDAGVRIDLIGRPIPAVVKADKGSCGLIEGIKADSPNAPSAKVDCTVPTGRRTFTAKCDGLPNAVLMLDIPTGSSHYIQFDSVCSSTAVDIEAINREPKTPPGIWRGRSRR
jgi:hypothetical protein